MVFGLIVVADTLVEGHYGESKEPVGSFPPTWLSEEKY